MMITPEEFILQHAEQPYDPVKAREYYLRTRKLKGRRKGMGTERSGRHPSSGSGSFVPRNSRIKTPEQRRKEIEARVEALKNRLEKLRGLLRKLVKQAQARSGIDPKDNSKTKKAAAGSKKLTSKQRREAAERSKEYREKHKKESLSDQEQRLREQIKDVEKKLRDAIARAREQSKKNPAANSRRNS